MNVLVVGGGGREAAMTWALSRSPRVQRVDCAPGNAGIAAWARCLPIDAEDLDGLLRQAREGDYALVVVGPEAPLVAGLADRLAEAGIPVFGASAAAAELEGSKAFSKRFMQRHGIPTAAFEVFDDPVAAKSHLDDEATRYPLVVKADGLAAGKGVLICSDRNQAHAAIDRLMSERAFGDAGSTVVVEECLEGREVSFFALSDGTTTLELPTCQDYKRALDGDGGLNTGGMGTYSPSVFLNEATRRTIFEEVVQPTIAGMAAQGRPYRGVLYTGLMLTADGPKVLEYNARFGDPETQVLLPRLDGDWFEVFGACANGRLADLSLRWTDKATVCVVMTAGGYPSSYPKGTPIDGLETAAGMNDVVVFHAGTRCDEAGQIVTHGGRVLGVTALGTDLAAARRRAYAAVEAIGWQGEHHRTDIAADAVRELQGDVG